MTRQQIGARIPETVSLTMSYTLYFRMRQESWDQILGKAVSVNTLSSKRLDAKRHYVIWAKALDGIWSVAHACAVWHQVFCNQPPATFRLPTTYPPSAKHHQAPPTTTRDLYTPSRTRFSNLLGHNRSTISVTLGQIRSFHTTCLPS